MDMDKMTAEELRQLINSATMRLNQAEQEAEKRKKEGAEKLAAAVSEANEALNRATAVADEYGLDFKFGPAYGMGGTYYGAKDRDYDDSDYYNSDEQGWVSSSAYC